MSRVFFMSAVLVMVSGCAGLDKGHDHSRDCTYRERDLTVAWEQREYWCVPDRVMRKPRVTYSVEAKSVE